MLLQDKGGDMSTVFYTAAGGACLHTAAGLGGVLELVVIVTAFLDCDIINRSESLTSDLIIEAAAMSRLIKSS